MRKQINVSLLPDLAVPEQFADKTAVVIDVLRATTTIVTALAAGAARIIPCLEVSEARQLARRSPGVLLGGERGGTAIAGFDFGNSPHEYNAKRVAGKSIAFTTTNGTRALQHCKRADSVLIGAFVNLSAVCGRLADSGQIELICAGTDGQVTREDVLLAGAIVVDQQLCEPDSICLNDQAQIAAAAWNEARALFAAGTPLAASLRESRGGRNLIHSGQQRDLEIAAAVDRYEVVPELDLENWEIRLR